MIDLHTHTVHSDGTTTPAQNAALAAAEGLAGLAVTDHDTVDGWEEAERACARHGLQFVPGVELSTEHCGMSVHLLGYWVDPDHPEFAAECVRLRHERRLRAEATLERLAALGVEIALEAVLAHSGSAPIGRPHIAQAMVDAGAVADLREAFDAYLADGGPAYVPKHALSPEDGLRLLRSAGAAVVLAHPGLSSAEPRDVPADPPQRSGPVDIALLDRLVEAGLCGVEADHAGHELDMVARWRGLADERGLLVTGSSDFHGDRKSARIGQCATSPGTMEALAGHARLLGSSTTKRR